MAWIALGILWWLALPTVGPIAAAAQGDAYLGERREMVDRQVRQRGVRDPAILAAMIEVPRHRFVSEDRAEEVYRDRPLTLDSGLTMTQAYVSARMISLLELTGSEKVLEIGTGSGYDAALLSRLADEVFTIEIDADFGRGAERLLSRLGYRNVDVRVGDGYRGWPEEAPFDAILVTAAAPHVPEPLFEQLAPGGRMVIAVGNPLHQDLKLVVKLPNGKRQTRRVSLVALTPMEGEITRRDAPQRRD
ncbi:MAG: protein-L-isoaspartate(D-aspartate) O-methyltransferase [Acidobacteriota bacterium]